MTPVSFGFGKRRRCGLDGCWRVAMVVSSSPKWSTFFLLQINWARANDTLVRGFAERQTSRRPKSIGKVLQVDVWHASSGILLRSILRLRWFADQLRTTQDRSHHL